MFRSIGRLPLKTAVLRRGTLNATRRASLCSRANTRQGFPYFPPPNPSQPQAGQNVGSGSAGTSDRQKRNVRGGDYENEQARLLQAALGHVINLGWTEEALIAGARDIGVSPAIVGSFPRKEAILVEYFMDDCLQRLIDKIDSGDLALTNLILSDRLAKLIRDRLEMQIPYISKWPQALSIQALPANLQTSFKQRTMLVDEIWHAAGDHPTNMDWYVKRTILGGIYSTTELYMITDHSPEFCDTWDFLNRRIKDAFDLQKTFQEASYLVEAVGAGVGSSLQGFVQRVFQK
ncbi:hypothetical protein H6P81_000322 [Aristolochia fimbriata]|uniref:Ubiquinone biosynthesis protein n=1 Tax=Aristolochia fimbriata TaxID=158543 RepID=A0AAV7F588_ARIFI|nr:hypothetical protein H6P81_000322 [Aristolochia fimbriata]